MHAAATDPLSLRRARAARMHGLYALTPECDDTQALVAKVSAALEGGATTVQYRSKRAPAGRVAQAQALARLIAARGGLYIVNDDPELAMAVDADGVHIGRDDASIMAARERVGPERLVGVSCYADLGRARDAVAQGADYVAFGSFFVSTVKPHAQRADPALLREARALGVPVVAIGGINADNVQSLIDAGADAVAVISDVFDHAHVDDVRNAADAIARRFASRHAS
ncbi:MAG TPA: thiamine phosphate synthase [Casimicrobiaceae bacterium]|jgi:thiamine-phosphate pyrophosphorylase|nr:thiamine phosphate synthase [Casimicrobiaceae bacterium]